MFIIFIAKHSPQSDDSKIKIIKKYININMLNII